MEDIAFSDWPGQPVDLNSGNNPWLPAYGFQTPTSLLEKEDFIGNPDAEYFLHCTTSGHYMYLETILEETSDDLRSESDIDSRGSPVGWLATDSESGSVIFVDPPDEAECDSDRELACPAKRRKQDFFLTLPNEDSDLNSLSRSSSLLQFETLEKQCQETCSSSPSIYSQFSFDSLEVNNRRNNVSPDSLNSPKSDSTEDENDFYKSLKIDVPIRKKQKSNDSLLYNATRYSSESSDSDVTLDASRSFDNLKTWRSFDSLPVVSSRGKDKVSVENLSEDSGYGENLTKSSSVNNLKDKSEVRDRMKGFPEKKNSYVGFTAYDGDVYQEHISGNFGISYQDLTVFKADQLDSPKVSPLIDHFMRTRKQRQLAKDLSHIGSAVTKILNLELPRREECGDHSNFKSTTSCSEPNLLSSQTDSQHNETQVCVSSVPKDLNFISDFHNSAISGVNGESVAAKNWNLADLQPESFFEDNEISVKSEEDMTHHYKREGSYAEAMANRVDLSDDEHSLINRHKAKLPRTTIVEFDRKVLKAISEQSLQDVRNSATNLYQEREPPKDRRYLEEVFRTTPIAEKRNIASTPNLAAANQFELVPSRYDEEERRKSVENLRRKSSIIKSSTSTSGMSDSDDKTLESIRSFGSNNSKGVHFSPVVSEVNWRDSSVSTVTPDRDSIYSFGSSSPERRKSPPKEIVKPRARLGTPVGLSYSQPELHEEESYKQEFVDSLRNLRQDFSKSQPDVNKLRRRGSQLIKKDKDGSVVKAYVDGDGIQYKHTHLDINLGFPHPPNTQTTGGGAPKQQKQNTINPPKPVETMEARDALRSEVGHARKEKNKTSGKLGGFFSRLASFRFSLKKGAEEKAKVKKKTEVTGSNLAPRQRIATKDDYIYIPLKGPGSTPINSPQQNAPTFAHSTPKTPSHSFNNHNNNSPLNPALTASKPPLPKQPPRVVHASVKKTEHAGVKRPEPNAGARRAEQHGVARRRRTIDSMEPMGLIETDLDTEVTVITSGNVKTTRSLLDLGPCQPKVVGQKEESGDTRHRPHKSMEFLLDKENLKVVEPPENELQKGERVMSEHQLRVQRSLQKLTVPEWYKQSQIPREGFLLKKHSPRETRWTGTSSKTTSLSSLGSNPQSPLILSPTPLNQPFIRWSTSKLNSTASSPCASTRSSFNARQPNGSISPSSVRSSFSYRQPYMGWRSQERLNRPRTPAERLASSLLANQSINHNHQPQESPEIQTSIKEVTSAIVHYVSGLRPDEARDRSYESQETASQRSSSVSPRGSQKLCWLESSFVGTRPLDSPQTPVTLSEGQSNSHVPPASLRLDLQAHNGKSVAA